MEKDIKKPRPATDEYHFPEDRRRRAKEYLLNAPHVNSDFLGGHKLHGKVHQVQFKVSPFVAKVGEEVAALFNLSLSQYTKALLYSNLGIFEPTDRRRKPKVPKKAVAFDLEE